MDNVYLIAGIIFAVIAAFFGGMAFASASFDSVKRENERLNDALRRLTDRDERGRFKGGK